MISDHLSCWIECCDGEPMPLLIKGICWPRPGPGEKCSDNPCPCAGGEHNYNVNNACCILTNLNKILYAEEALWVFS